MDNKSRYITTKKVGILGAIFNVILLTLKLIFGIISNSQALIADAFNSAGDILSSVMTYIGNKIASEPSDNDHNYGHGKAEYVFSLLIGLSMIILSFKTLANSSLSIIHNEKLTFSWWLVLVCIITIITKFFLYLYTSKQGKKHNSLLITANSKDHFNDMFITLSTLIGIIASLINIYWLDGVIGIFISAWICYTGIRISIEGYKILMDEAINERMEEEIIETIKTYSKIDHIDKITSKPIGNNYIIIVKLSIDGNMTINESHDIVSKLKYDILKINHISDVIIHVNPA